MACRVYAGGGGQLIAVIEAQKNYTGNWLNVLSSACQTVKWKAK